MKPYEICLHFEAARVFYQARSGKRAMQLLLLEIAANPFAPGNYQSRTMPERPI